MRKGIDHVFRNMIALYVPDRCPRQFAELSHKVKRVPTAYERPFCIILVYNSFVVVMVVGFGTYEERCHSLAVFARATDRPTDGLRRASRPTWWSFMRLSYVLVLLSNHMLLFLLHAQQLAAAAVAPTMYHQQSGPLVCRLRRTAASWSPLEHLRV
jgi:hypothetical protein